MTGKTEVREILLRLPEGLRPRLDEYRGDVPLNTIIVRMIESAVNGGVGEPGPSLPATDGDPGSPTPRDLERRDVTPVPRRG